MATLVLGAIGASIGGGIGGSVLGMSAAVVGRAAGSTLGRIIDQKIIGSGSDVVEYGRIDRFRINGATEGAAISRIAGAYRLPGQVIWSSQFNEEKSTSGGGGKGAPSQPASTTYEYFVSLAVSVCEGQISRIGRIWADGTEIQAKDFTFRVYTGAEDQLPDSVIEVIEGADQTPAYRGMAYVVFDRLPLKPFGNRVPQFSFEVIRSVDPQNPDLTPAPARTVPGVALIPGTGEYSLATTPVHVDEGLGRVTPLNMNTPSGESDFDASLRAAEAEMPALESILLISSWFGSDLRCNSCTIKPKVDQNTGDPSEMPWRVAGLDRFTAEILPKVDGKSVYGGTPTDQSVIEALASIRARGKRAVFYPFILMEVLDGNTLPDPYSGAEGQPSFPWRGRITTERAPSIEGSTDGTVAAVAEVDSFFGAVNAGDFSVSSGTVSYTGPADDWGYSRFILHNAAICAAAGGVDAFCIGSEMRALTHIRGDNNSFPAVAQLVALLAEVRSLLPDAKLGYAADWSEYFGYQSPEGDVFFHLDPLWADDNLDFIGMDNYMPLSDWRDGDEHLDASFGSIYNEDYLMANVAGGEGYDWYYPDQAARDAQERVAITDGAFDEPWIYRYKDIKNWWSLEHHERVGGIRSATPSAWVPQSKPIWFTEFGCAAIDKGTNQPNKFIDAKSSESALPHYSNGRRDDFLQMRYIQATLRYWSDPSHNPTSELYDGAMIDMSRAHVWAYDARPWPEFPNNTALWSDGENYKRGHWLNGRLSAQPLALVVAELCERAGYMDYDVSRVEGLVQGFEIRDMQSTRSSLQPLLMAYGLDVTEVAGKLVFTMRKNARLVDIDPEEFVDQGEGVEVLKRETAPTTDVAGKVMVDFVEAASSYQSKTVEAAWPQDGTATVSQTELPLVLSVGEGHAVAERWQAQSRVSRDTVAFTLPPSRNDILPGDLVRFDAGAGVPEVFRVDRIDDQGIKQIEAIRTEVSTYDPADILDVVPKLRPTLGVVPVFAQFMDLPIAEMMDEAPGPHVAVNAVPWRGDVAVFGSMQQSDYALKGIVSAPSVVGTTLTALEPARAGVWDRGPALRVEVSGGALASAERLSVLNGANVMAIGNGTIDTWEIFQFQNAVLVAPNTYEISLRLRGQNGTEAFAAQSWPAGSTIVLLGRDLNKLPMDAAQRDLPIHYLIGPANRPYDDATYSQQVWPTAGVALKPYRPAHLTAETTSDGGMTIRWIRRTRVDGDTWAGLDVPVSEAREAYQVTFVRDDAIISTIETATSTLTIPAAEVTALALGAGDEVHVVQLSDRFGLGTPAVLSLS